MDNIKPAYQLFLDWIRDTLPFITTVWVSTWGGVVSHIQRLRKSKKKFDIKELILDIIVSSFVGYITYLICQYSHLDGSISSALIAISGHMGARAMAKYEKFAEDKLGLDPLDTNHDQLTKN